MTTNTPPPPPPVCPSVQYRCTRWTLTGRGGRRREWTGGGGGVQNQLECLCCVYTLRQGSGVVTGQWVSEWDWINKCKVIELKASSGCTIFSTFSNSTFCEFGLPCLVNKGTVSIYQIWALAKTFATTRQCRQAKVALSWIPRKSKSVHGFKL